MKLTETRHISEFWYYGAHTQDLSFRSLGARINLIVSDFKWSSHASLSPLDLRKRKIIPLGFNHWVKFIDKLYPIRIAISLFRLHKNRLTDK